MIKDLSIKQYRLFKELNIDNFGQVNLIVGTNNSGKSNLLEAIHLCSNEDNDIHPTYDHHSTSRINQISKLVTANNLNYIELATLWDDITLTPQEDQVIAALQILEPTVERLSFTSSQTSNSGILLRLANEAESVPLDSMGDGMRRILAIIASLVSVGNGNLLIDEIDTGLYYGVLTDMWRMVIRTARQQNAQVFATTHSWDCIKAFQQALAMEDDAQVGQLIRLDRIGEQTKAVIYDADKLEIAITQEIEIR